MKVLDNMFDKQKAQMRADCEEQARKVHAIRDEIVERWKRTHGAYGESIVKLQVAIDVLQRLEEQGEFWPDLYDSARDVVKAAQATVDTYKKAGDV